MATFCLLHGKWHDPASWEPLVRELGRSGHACVTPEIPFGDPAAGHEQRAAPAVAAVRGADGPVVVVGHSLAGAVAPIVAARGEASMLVYLCPAPNGPFAGVDVGVAPFRDGFPFPPDRPDGISSWEPDVAIEAMYPRLPEGTAREMAARLRPGATMPDRYPLDGHPDVVAAFIAAREDEFFVLEWSRRIAVAVLGKEAVEIESGHFPMVEIPHALAKLLDGLAG